MNSIGESDLMLSIKSIFVGCTPIFLFSCIGMDIFLHFLDAADFDARHLWHFSNHRATLRNISLRLLALILCSNCSNNFNKLLTDIVGHFVKLLFENQRIPLSLLNIPHAWSWHFTRRHDSCTPPQQPTNQTPTLPRPPLTHHTR